MTHERHTQTFERLLDDLPVGPPPIDELLASRTAVRRRRRTTLGASVATAGVVIGVGLSIPLIGSTPDRRDPAVTAPSGPTPLRTEVRSASLAGQDAHTAVWDASEQTLRYLSPPAYSSSCPPTATAMADGNGVVTIELDEEMPEVGMVCTADAGVVRVVVHGLDSAPASLVVAALGETGPVPVVDAGDEVRQPWEAMRLPCSQTQQVHLDIPGPGQPTPQEAVQPYLNGLVIHLVSTSGRRATITAMNAEGEVRRSYAVRLLKDGWWPDGYVECLG